MVGLLNTSNLSGPKRGQTASYSTPQATTLMGAGNSKITDDQIRAFINANQNNPNKILQTALDNGVSISQYANAAGIDPSQARSFIESQGINLNPSKNNTLLLNNSNRTTQGSIATNTSVPNNPFGGNVEVPTVAPQPVPEPDRVSYDNVAPPPAVTYNPAAISTTRLNPKTDTVQGQLNTILQDSNSPLMVAARTRGEQYANKRGLLNSSLGAEASNKAMIDAALDIATPDAATNANTALQNTAALNQGNQFNAQQGLLASQTNADNIMRTSMFNTDAGLRASMYNADNQFKTGMYNSDLASRIGMFNTGTAADILKNRESLSTSILNNRESLGNSIELAQMDTDLRTALADLDVAARDSQYGAALISGFMELQKEILTSDNGMSPEQRQESLAGLAKTLTTGLNLFPTIEAAIGDFTFGNDGNNESVMSNQSQSGQQVTPQGKSVADPSVSLLPDGSAKPVKNPTGYTIPADRVQSIQNYNAKYGQSYDPGKLVALEELEGMTPEQRFANFDPLPLYDREGNLKIDTALFHRV